MSWTSMRIERLNKLAADGLSASQIAVALGDVTRNAVISKLRRSHIPLIGFPYTTWTKVRIARLKELLADKLPCKNIAADLGVTEKAIRRKIDRLDLPRRRKPKAESRPQFRFSRKGRLSNPTRIFAKVNGHDPGYIDPEPELIDNIIPIGQRRTLLELTGATCRWPIGDPGTPDFFFCGAQSETGRPYCPHHCRIACEAPAGPMHRGPCAGSLPDDPRRLSVDVRAQMSKAAAKRPMTLAGLK